jgi:hypothetical protein
MCAIVGGLLPFAMRAQSPDGALRPGTRVLLDAHNAYPENGRFADRLDRALATGLPIAVEQDLAWYTDPATGASRSIVSHGPPFTGTEPTLDEYFIRKVTPLIAAAVRAGRRDTWPVVTLNLDFKTNEPEHHRAVWELLGRYEEYLVTASRTASAQELAELRVAPVLVLTGDADEQERSFHDRVAVGDRLRLFGAVHHAADGSPRPRSNYRRWVNYPWAAVEPEGQPRAGAWTAEDERRLTSLVQRAHEQQLWIRFYTLNGHDPADTSGGWTASYNFGSLEAARVRWRAAVRAGVDFVAVDQYEMFAGEIRPAAAIEIAGVLHRADYETLLEREFDVPAGTERIDVELAYEDRDRTVIDLGLRGPAAFRGWSGGGPQRVFVSTQSATPGYTPGPVEPGRWAVVLGVPNIRENISTPYRVTVRFAGAPPVVLATQARWYVGDLHAHSGHSDGRTIVGGRRERVPPHHVFDAARRAGLDFIALTDHNTASHWLDVDRFQPMYPQLLLLHGREVTTYRGHLNAFGERRFTDFRLGSDRPMSRLAQDLRDAGAWISINHPTRPDDESCMGCGWNDRDQLTVSSVHGVEILNGDGEGDSMAGWRFWAEMLNKGHRLVAIGGSDEHTPDEQQDRRLGQPATVVYAEQLSEAALLDGLRSGRAYVRARGPEGPELDFQLERTATGVQLTVVAGRAEGQRVEWIRNGEIVAVTPLTVGGRATHAEPAKTGDWFSVILRDRLGPTAFSNALYVDDAVRRGRP